VDGELTTADRAIAQQHIEACWRCRAHVAEVEAAIANISRYDQQILQPRQTPPPAQQRMFQMKLQQLVEEADAPASGWRDWLTERLTMRWISAVAAVAAGLLIEVFWLSASPLVSARELLERATQAETRRHATLSQPVSHPVIYRQVQVRKSQAGRTQTARWELWREAATRISARPAHARKCRRTNETRHAPLRQTAMVVVARAIEYTLAEWLRLRRRRDRSSRPTCGVAAQINGSQCVIEQSILPFSFSFASSSNYFRSFVIKFSPRVSLRLSKQM
jgi:hypothetical protein